MPGTVSSDPTSGSFKSFDDTDLAYQRIGPEVPSGLPVVLSNGLGGDYRAWKHIFTRFAQQRTFVTWDYRGLYRSGKPRTPGTLGPPFQALDLKALLDHLGFSRVVLIGWSMGVQVNFEAWRRFPERIAGIGVINGVAGRPFETALGGRVIRHLIPRVIKQMRRNARLVGKLSSVATGWSGLLPLMQKLGMVGATLDMALFADFAKTFATLDFDLYGATLSALGRHDAHDVLQSINVPVRIITGDRDVLTPLKTAERLRKDIPGATLRVLAGGTHYTPVEYPDAVCDELELLFARAEANAAKKGAA
jgi:pimeloyl-ACP methyl ester carboxylesterase